MPTAAPGAAAGLPRGVPDLPPLHLPQQLLARSALHPVARPGQRVPRPVGDARGGGLVRDLVGGAGRAALALCAAGSGRRTGRSRCIPTSPPRSPSVAESLDYRRRPKVVVTSLDFPTVAYQWLARAGEGVEVVDRGEPGRDRRAGRGRRARRGRSHRAGGHEPRLLHQRRHPGRARAGRCRPPRRARCCWWTATRRRASCRWTCARSTSTSTAAAGSSGCSAAPASPSCTPARSSGRRWLPRASGWFAHRDQFRFDPRVARAARRRPPARGRHAAAHAGLRPARRARACSRSSAPAEIRRRTMALTEDLIEGARAAGLRPKVAAAPEDRTGDRHAAERRSARPTSAGWPRRASWPTAGRATCASRPTSTTSRTTTGPPSSA